LDTVRGEISQCIEKAYPKLGVKEAAKLLFFDGSDANGKALEYGKKRKWKLNEQEQFFQFGNTNQSTGNSDENVVDAARLAEQNIFYAKQLEMIV